MKAHKSNTMLFLTGRERRNALMVLMAMLCLGGTFLAGCGKMDDSAVPPGPTPPPAATLGAAPGAPGQETVKGTPEQEAAKQRAIDEGPAIQAANDPAQAGK